MGKGRAEVADPARNDWPKTVDEAVDRLVATLSEARKRQLRELPKGELGRTHHGLGMTIRNIFGLWQGNRALLNSCAAREGYPSGMLHPDDVSIVIVRALWERLQTSNDTLH